MLNALRLPEADAQCQQTLELSAPAAIRGLQLLPKLQDWAMLGLLICPGMFKVAFPDSRSRQPALGIHTHQPYALQQKTCVHLMTEVACF